MSESVDQSSVGFVSAQLAEILEIEKTAMCAIKALTNAIQVVCVASFEIRSEIDDGRFVEDCRTTRSC